jgi:hypothetical protein
VCYCTAYLLYNYCTNCNQLPCTYSNYTDAAATCSAAQQHGTFTLQILYKLYILQLSFTYSNYTEAAASCSASHQHGTFSVQILYKLYILQLNCTYSNYTEPAATCSAAQHYPNGPADILMCSAIGSFKYLRIKISTYTFSHVVRSDLSNLRFCTKHNITFSQYYETHPTVCPRHLQVFCLHCIGTFRSVA